MNVKRVSARLTRDNAARIPCDELRCHLFGVGLGEFGDVDERAVRNRVSRFEQRRNLDVLVPIRENKKQPWWVVSGHQRSQNLLTFPIMPLHIVDDQDERMLFRNTSQQLSQRMDRTSSLPHRLGLIDSRCAAERHNSFEHRKQTRQ